MRTSAPGARCLELAGGAPARFVAKVIAITIAVILGVFLAVGIALYLVDWNRLRDPITAALSTALNRPLVINGAMKMEWSWTPRLSVNSIELKNSDWGVHRPMFTAQRLTISLHLPDLSKGHIVLPEIQLIRPDLYLEKDALGRTNWEFSKRDGDDRATSWSQEWFPKIQKMEVQDGRVQLTDEGADRQLDLHISTVFGQADEFSLKLDGTGKLQKKLFSLDASGGAIVALWDSVKPYPIDVKLIYGESKARIYGTVIDPKTFAGPNLHAEVSGPDLSVFQTFTEAWVPPTPTYRFAGQITRKNDIWSVANFDGRMGNSDGTGNFSFTLREGRPYLRGDVYSQKLDFRDFAGFIGIDPKTDAPSGPRLLPDKPYTVESMRVVDVDIHFKSDNIVTPSIPVDHAEAHVMVDHGQLQLDPLVAHIGLGRIHSSILLDARKSLIHARVQAHIERVPFKRLMEKTPFEAQSYGVFEGQMDLTMTGNSIAAMAAAADGGVSLSMENGRVSALMVELAGLDLLHSMGLLLSGDHSLAARCTVADFIASDGILQSKLIIMDTTDSNLLADGRIDLHDESLDFGLAVYPKDFSLISANTPIRITGSLKAPKIRLEPLPLAARIATSIGLGVVAGPAAVLPWIDLGVESDSPCRALIQAARQQTSAKKVLTH